MTPSQRSEVWDIVQSFNTYLPPGPLAAHMERVKQHEGETWFAWIGGYDLGDPYYFRIHSPVVFCEVSQSGPRVLLALTFWVDKFDFHCGSECLSDSRGNASDQAFSFPYQHVSCQVSHPYDQSTSQYRRLRQGAHPAVSCGAEQEMKVQQWK
jgi:hypothetical protein